MGIVFAVRGDSVDARYSNGGKEGIKVGDTANITINTDASYLSGHNIQFAGGSVKVLTWPGRLNTPNGRAVSILHRYSPQYTGSPASSRTVLPGLYVTPDRMGRIEVTHSAAGNVVVLVTNETATAIVNSVSAGAWSPTSGTIYDVVLTWDGTASANSLSVYIDGTLLGSITPTAAFTASWTNKYFNAITWGNASTSSLAVSKTDEIVIWDSVINVSAVTLDSGTGALNGASRTSLVAVSSFDGANYTDPAAANVKINTTYVFAGTSTVGTYTGSDRWNDPGDNNVRSGVTYAANSTTNNKTGRVTVPIAANVHFGITFETDGATTGTYTGADRWSDPGVTNVKSGVTYMANSVTNNKTGTYDVSIANAVWSDSRALTVAKFMGLK